MKILAKILALSLFIHVYADSTYEDCVSNLTMWAESIGSIKNTKYTQMIEYSGRGINDLGLYYQCEDVNDATYVIFEILDTPAVIVLALCLPSECTVDDYKRLLNMNNNSSFTTYVKELYAPLMTYEHQSQYFQNYQRRLQSSSSSLIKNIVFPKDHVDSANNMTASAGLMLFVCVLLIFLGILGTVVELYTIAKSSESIQSSSDSSGEISNQTKDSEKINSGSSSGSAKKKSQTSKFVKILKCFSLYTNFLNGTFS